VIREALAARLAGPAAGLAQRRLVRQLILEMGGGEEAPVEALLAGWGYHPRRPKRAGVHDQCFEPRQDGPVPATG